MAGVFQIDREIFNNSIWNNPAEFRLFFFILGNAVWKEEGVKYGDIDVKRGQYLRSYRNLREDLKYSDGRTIKYYSLSYIKKIVDKLVKDGRLNIEETELGTLFSVVNYCKYQGFERFDNSYREHPNYREHIENTSRTPHQEHQNIKGKHAEISQSVAVDNSYREHIENTTKAPYREHIENNKKKDKNNKNNNDDDKASNILQDNILSEINILVSNKLSSSTYKNLISRFGLENINKLKDELGRSTWLRENITWNISQGFLNKVLAGDFKDFKTPTKTKETKFHNFEGQSEKYNIDELDKIALENTRRRNNE